MESFMCTEMQEDLQVDNVRECDFTLHNFEYPEQQEAIQHNVQKESNDRENEHEESLDYNEEENIEAVQQKLQMKSKLAIENMIKSNITVDLLKHKICDEKAKINVLDEKIKLLIDERDHLKNAEFIQNAKFNQLTRELGNLKNIVEIFNKHSIEDDAEQQNMESKITKQEDFFDKFKNEASTLFQKLNHIRKNAEKYNSLISYNAHTSTDYKQRIQTMETILNGVQNEIKENDEDLTMKRKLNEEINTENEKLKSAIEAETLNYHRFVNELSALRKITEDLGFENNEKQIMMNSGIEQCVNEIKTKEKELESLSEKEILLKQQLDELKNKNTTTYNEIDCLNEKITMNRKILDTERDKIKTIHKEIEGLLSNHKITLEKISHDVEKINQDHASVKSERKSAIKEIEATKLSLDKLNKQLSHNKLRIELTQSNANDLTVNLNQLNKDKLELSEYVKSLEANLQSSNEKYNSFIETYNTTKVDEGEKMLQLRNEVSQYAEELSSQIKSSAKEIDDLKQAHSIQINLKHNMQQEGLDKLQKVYDDLKQGLQTVTDDKIRLQDELSKKSALKDSLYSKYNNFQNEADQLKMEQVAGSSQKPVGILKSPSTFAVPSAPAKSVTFKPTVSWNSPSVTSLESLLEELNRDAQPSRDIPCPSSQKSLPSETHQDFDAFLKELYKESPQRTSEEVHGSYCSSPPVRLSDMDTTTLE